jgi:hypothetical protein
LETQEIRWERDGAKKNEKHELGLGFFVQNTIISKGKTFELVSDRMLYIILRFRLCDVVVLNVHISREDKIDYVKGSFYEELERVR